MPRSCLYGKYEASSWLAYISTNAGKRWKQQSFVCPKVTMCANQHLQRSLKKIIISVETLQIFYVGLCAGLFSWSGTLTSCVFFFFFVFAGVFFVPFIGQRRWKTRNRRGTTCDKGYWLLVLIVLSVICCRYYNWSTAAPVMLAMQVYQKPLPQVRPPQWYTNTYSRSFLCIQLTVRCFMLTVHGCSGRSI